MKNVSYFLSSCVVIVLLTVSSCSAPKTFIKTMEPTWANIELRQGISYNDAWKKVLDILIQRFDIEVSEQESGYIRTGWLYTWTGDYKENYRVRITVKFKIEDNVLRLKTEAIYNDYTGYDTRLLQTVKSDIMGSIGRVAR